MVLFDAYGNIDINSVSSAIENWKNKKGSSSIDLDNNTLKILKNKFSFKESGFYEIQINIEDENNLSFSSLSCGINLRNKTTSKTLYYYFGENFMLE